MLYDLDIDKQREQFAKVIDRLMQNGNKNKDIAARIGLSPYDIPKLISGARKNISNEVIENLHEEFGINPNYITKGASNMYDIPGIKYNNFENFVNDWDLVEHENKEYLHFTMDENFYKFLIDVYKLKEASSASDNITKMVDAFEKAFESLKTNFSVSNNSKEYVLIPADDVLNIAQDNVSRRKSLCEVIDILNIYPPEQ